MTYISQSADRMWSINQFQKRLFMCNVRRSNEVIVQQSFLFQTKCYNLPNNTQMYVGHKTIENIQLKIIIRQKGQHFSHTFFCMINNSIGLSSTVINTMHG